MKLWYRFTLFQRVNGIRAWKRLALQLTIEISLYNLARGRRDGF